MSGTNTYVLGEREAVVIDPGPDEAAHMARVLGSRPEEADRRIAVILLTHTHSDHAGGVAALARGSGAAVRGWKTIPPLRDEAWIEVGTTKLQALYTPGHSADHLVFYWPLHGVVFAGDLILGEGTVTVGPPDGSVAAYLRSLERVAALRPALIAPGHGPLVRDPEDRIRSHLAHRRQREAEILARLAGGARTVPALAAAIYPALDPRLRGAAEGNVLAHLQKLVDEGRVERNGTEYALRKQEGEEWR